jgi:hypothetical protein
LGVKDKTACNNYKKKVGAGVNVCGAWIRAMRIGTKGINVKFTRIM